MFWEFVSAVFSSWTERVGIVLTILPFIDKIPWVKKRFKNRSLIDVFVPLLKVIGIVRVFYGFFDAWRVEHEKGDSCKGGIHG